MLILNEENLTDYIRGHLAEKLGLASSTVIKNVASAGGGLVSAVFKAQVGKENLYFKQAIPGKLDKVRELVGDTVPADAFVVWYAERQFAEVKALQIVKQAVTDYFVPTVYCHDADNNIMVLSEVCGGDGVVLAEVMNTEINLRHAEILGENIAKVANFTYGKFDSLRDDQLEAKLKEVKYRYEVRDVWENITKSETKKLVIDKVSRLASVSSEMNSVLVHGDFHDRNIIVGENCCGTYDLEECHWGDPAEDIGKLTTSYLLRMIYFDQLRQAAYEAAIKLLESYFKHLSIPESRNALESRMRVLIAGCLLMRVDGVSSMWLPWVHDNNKKSITRQAAVKLVLQEGRYSLIDILKQIFSEF